MARALDVFYGFRVVMSTAKDVITPARGILTRDSHLTMRLWKNSSRR